MYSIMTKTISNVLGTALPMSLAYIDMQPAAPHISQRLDTIRAACQNLFQLWQVRKMKLEQCFQLRLFESDIEKVGHSGSTLYTNCNMLN